MIISPEEAEFLLLSPGNPFQQSSGGDGGDGCHSVFSLFLIFGGFFWWLLVCFLTQDVNCGPLVTSIIIFNLGIRRDKHLSNFQKQKKQGSRIFKQTRAFNRRSADVARLSPSLDLWPAFGKGRKPWGTLLKNSR